MAGASFAAQPEHETISVRRIGFLLSWIVLRSDSASHRERELSISMVYFKARSIGFNDEAVTTFSPGLRSYPGKGWLLYVPTATRLRQSGVVPEFEDEVSTESGSDRVTVLAISILAIGGDPVATALGTDCITHANIYEVNHTSA